MYTYIAFSFYPHGGLCCECVALCCMYVALVVQEHATLSFYWDDNKALPDLTYMKHCFHASGIEFLHINAFPIDFLQVFNLSFVSL